MFTIANPRGRPTKKMQAARLRLAHMADIRDAALLAHHERELALASVYAELEGRPMTCWDWNDAYNDLEADRLKVMRANPPGFR
jgi:hypothetical protein